MGITASMNSDRSPVFDDLDQSSIQPYTISNKYFTSQVPSACTTPACEVEQAEPEATQNSEEEPEAEENVAEAIARICTNFMAQQSTQPTTQPSTSQVKGVPDVYIIWVDKTLIGYKASWKATKRTVDTLMTQSLQQMPLGGYKYWWSKPKSVDSNSTRYILFAQAYNNLISYPSTCSSITIQRIPYVHQVKMNVEPSYNFKPKFTLTSG